jgi:circadian clock protein KaiB
MNRTKGRASLAASGGSAAARWDLRLYVAGDSPKSRTALENLKRLCATHLGENYSIEIVDLRKKPELAKIDQILAVPTLIRKIPQPMKRVIGDLSDPERAIVALDLRAHSRALSAVLEEPGSA